MNDIKTQSIVVICFAAGSFVLAIVDHNFRPVFGDIATIAISGYIGYLIPKG